MNRLLVFASVLTVGSVTGPPVQPASFKIGLSFTSSRETDKRTRAEAPDVGGAVGPSHVAEFINGEFKVYDKKTGKLLLAQTSDVFWDAALGTTGTNPNNFDPHMVFD